MLPKPPRNPGIVSKRIATPAITAIAGRATKTSGARISPAASPVPEASCMTAAAIASTPTIAASTAQWLVALARV